MSHLSSAASADDDLLRQIASYGRGYTYLLSRAGVTGTENRAALPLNHLVAKLKEYNAAPPLGVWYFRPDRVKAALMQELRARFLVRHC